MAIVINKAPITNVVTIEPNKLLSDIKTFFDSRKYNTRKTYEKGIRDFFKIMKDKDLEDLVVEDLNIRLSEVERFRVILKDSGYKNSTINSRITSLRKLLRFLKANEYDIKNDFFSEVRKLKENPESYGLLTLEEITQLADFVRDTEREKPLLKYYLIHTAFRTSFRLEALLSIQWADIEDRGNMFMINAIDKGEEHRQSPIDKEFFHGLLELKEEGSGKVFDISAETVQRMMSRVTEKMGIPKERNICFHSIRGTGSHFVLDVTGDPKAAMRQSGHKSFDVWWNNYINKGDVDFTQMAGILINQKLDISILERLEKSKLIQIVSRLSKRSQIEIMKIAEEYK